jgi:hypothetical protein
VSLGMFSSTHCVELNIPPSLVQKRAHKDERYV